MSKQHEVLILGAGLSGLIAACYLWDHGKRDIAVVTSGYGGTPYVAAFNAVLKDSPHGDTPQKYCEDMLAAGYDIGNRRLVEKLGGLTGEVVELLERWGISFSRLEDGSYRLRHASGSRCPRSLCRTDMLIGEHITETLVAALKEKGVVFYEKSACVALHTEGGAVSGVTASNGVEPVTLSSGTVLAAWGGVGNLYNDSTYPGDIDGRTLAMAYEAGVNLIDLEFVEFEPMVSLEPPAARGEPCPTAMLGEGAHLLNSEGERFLLQVRPQGEAGAPKSLINQAIWAEVKAGRGGPLGGVYVDLRHIEEETLKAYPWFYWRLKNAGLDVKTSLLQVGPMAHSHSGGMEIGEDCMTNIKGLYAAGEAAGGMHGACRMAGNAATQAAASGLAAAKSMLGYAGTGGVCAQGGAYREDLAVREKNAPRIRAVVAQYINRERDGDGLREAIRQLETLKGDSAPDTFSKQLAMSGILLAHGALAREESRGTHLRTDFPEKREEFRCSIRLSGKDGAIRTERVAR